MPSTSVDIPPEILRRILLFTLPSAGPPTILSSLRSTCRRINNSLSQCQADLYTRIFALQFDFSPPFRRLGCNRQLVSQNVEIELRRRFQILSDLRFSRLPEESLEEALWMIYIILMEDEGRNLQQLRWASVHVFLQTFLRDRLYVGAECNHAWPIENHRNALAIACMWLMSSKALILSETSAERESIMNDLLPIVEAAFRYPCFLSPEGYISGASLSSEHSSLSSTIHGSYPPAPSPSHMVQIFGSIARPCFAPAMSSFAILNYFVRADVIPHAIPPHLPGTRAEAVAANLTGPTREDMQHFIDHCNTKFAVGDAEFTQRSGWEHESDWLRLVGQSAYVLGSFTGRFKGSMMVPCIEHTYMSWLSSLDMPRPFPAFGRRPLSLIIKEYYCTDASSCFPHDDPANGIKNAWLPAGFKFIEQDDGVEILNEDGSYQCFYKSCKSDLDYAESKNVVDVIIIAKPDEAYKVAWGGFHLFGRIRLSDGLAVMAGEAVEAINPSIFRGYVISSQNFVGRSRGQLTSGFEPANWEAAFSLSKSTTE